MFQHAAARRRLDYNDLHQLAGMFQHAAARRRLDAPDKIGHINVVSTRSRPKAAVGKTELRLIYGCFNTQPPEGGWVGFCGGDPTGCVSTRSRPKAAASKNSLKRLRHEVSTRSRPKAAVKIQTPITR